MQQCINRAIFELLDYIVLYPVEDEGKFTDRKGVILPDAFLMKRGSTARDLAFRVHSDIGESFLFAIDAKTQDASGREARAEGWRRDKDSLDEVKAETINILFSFPFISYCERPLRCRAGTLPEPDQKSPWVV